MTNTTEAMIEEVKNKPYGAVCTECGKKYGPDKSEGVGTASRSICLICGVEGIHLPKRHYGL